MKGVGYENPPVVPILENSCIGDGIIKDVTCMVVDEANTSTFDITPIWMKSPRQTYDKTIVEAVGILLDPIITENGGLQEQSKKGVKTCKCGSESHFRRSHKVCPLNPKNCRYQTNFKWSGTKLIGLKGLKRMLKKQDNKMYKNHLEPDPCIKSDDEKLDTDPVPVLGLVPVLYILNTSKEMNSLENASSKNNSANEKDPKLKESEPEYYRPTFTKIEENFELTYEPVIDVHSRNFKAAETTLKIFSSDNKEERPPTPLVMVEHYFNDALIQGIVNSSNAYVFERKRREPILSAWKKKNATKEITPSGILQFLAILHYIGIVRLPSKTFYWSKGYHWMSSHPICSTNGVSPT